MKILLNIGRISLLIAIQMMHTNANGIDIKLKIIFIAIYSMDYLMTRIEILFILVVKIGILTIDLVRIKRVDFGKNKNLDLVKRNHLSHSDIIKLSLKHFLA